MVTVARQTALEISERMTDFCDLCFFVITGLLFFLVPMNVTLRVPYLWFLKHVVHV